MCRLNCGTKIPRDDSKVKNNEKNVVSGSPNISPISLSKDGRICIRLHVKPGAKRSRVISRDEHSIGLQVFDFFNYILADI